MKLNKLNKTLLVILPMFALAACKSNSQTTDDVYTGDDGMLMESGQLPGFGGGNEFGSLSDQARMQLQDLQRDNIIYFGFDQYDIGSNYMMTLDAHAAFLRDNPSIRVVIEGHTDERGTAEYNIALGERRANATRIYLQGRGVSDEQMQIVSYGKEKPAVYGNDESAFAKNRRSVLVY
ncbi:peptidoglycan-associated lipoprotein Pal [Thorsellia anophelis]|uniref:Peptidoglycan-associated lipoprotein n=1 Tax=Thorsellia anophelis DSM 18579 TaxID=1123402 RepID=A0A1H9ZVW3_9GAMM|nr:peptidoglycan-associated lipoprotein Pal [Thorsellia anophelis]SES85477.1 peptidoglycan-associated lipoprotein [Thorsellia anophelis DSM 18579]